MKSTVQYGPSADQALSLWVKMARATETLGMLTAKDIAGYGLTVPQFGVIEVLGHLGPLKIGQICEKKLMTGGNITVVIDNLEKAQLVERVRDVNDRRAYVIRLTSKGKKLFSTIFVNHAKFVDSMISDVLNEHEIATLSALLKKLGLALKVKLNPINKK